MAPQDPRLSRPDCIETWLYPWAPGGAEKDSVPIILRILILVLTINGCELEIFIQASEVILEN